MCSVGLVTAMFSVGAGNAAESESERDVWGPFRRLLGTWRGEASGFGNVSDVTHDWGFAVQGRFIELRTRSVQRSASGTGEVHEDVGFLSHDADQDGFAFRQFLSEGFVNTFTVIVDAHDPLTILFRHRDSESSGGTRARMRLRFVGEDEYEMVLDLASPGREFTACQQMRMRKLR